MTTRMKPLEQLVLAYCRVKPTEISVLKISQIRVHTPDVSATCSASDANVVSYLLVKIHIILTVLRH